MSAVTLTMDRQLHAPQAGDEQRTLRKACNEFLGMAMFSQMLRQARESTLNSDLFGSSAEKIFQGQLDEVLIRSAGGDGETPGAFGGLGEALYRELAQQATAAESTIDVEG